MKIILFVLSLIVGMPASVVAHDGVLLVGDVVEMHLSGVPGGAEVQSSVFGPYKVDEQGDITMSYIGKVRAAGLTLARLKDAIEGSYKSRKIYTDPHITVRDASEQGFVRVCGQVRSPQKVAFTPDPTVLGVIMAAGGFTEYADVSKVRIHRGEQVIVFNLRQARVDPSTNFRLLPDDLIEVPQDIL